MPRPTDLRLNGPCCNTAKPARPRASSGQPGIEKQPARAEQQQEAQVPPAVAPGAQVRRPVAAVRAQRGRHLARCAGPASAALTTISLANSMPGRDQAEPLGWPLARSRAGRSGSRRSGCGRTGGRRSSGPGCRGSGAAHGIAPGAMPPLKRLPITRSAPARSRSTNASKAGEVVAVVGVAHDDEAAARGVRCRPCRAAP